ncbi:MAG: CDP-alcohol phosphatidyltransferase family protein [Verrucomicrobiae bacterium]|nr:CDP-alcohol phosphatidyltransferase family protein [Verrucomicrobiae bacterium]
MHHLLTISRICLAAGFCAMVWLAVHRGQITTSILIALLALGIAEELTDLFDGILARRFGATSELGGLLDPLADSLARLAIYFALAQAGWVTMAVPLVMTARDLLVAYSRIVLARTGGKTAARFSGKLKAWVQGVGFLLLVLLAWMSERGFPEITNKGRMVVSVVLVLVTAWSSIEYMRAAWPGLHRLARPQSPVDHA